MKKTVVAVLFGGCSTEYEVSLQSAAAVLENLDPEKFATLTVGITREGRWLYYNGPLEKIGAGTWCGDTLHCLPCSISPDRGAHQLVVYTPDPVRYGFDIAFPVLHGKNGEDGTVQGLLELAGIPIVGCGTLSSALCMDKDRAHKLAALAGVPAPRSAVFPADCPYPQIEQAARALGLPLFVKPVRAGSSFGITRVARLEELPGAVALALEHDREVLLEQAIPGFEVGCAVMGNQELTVGRVDEIELLRGGMFDYEEKYTLKTSRIHMPARIAPETEQQVRQAAQTIYRALGCQGFARVDLFLTPEGSMVFNEVNTIPGFTAHSRWPNMMKGVGIGFAQALEQLIQLGLEA